MSDPAPHLLRLARAVDPYGGVFLVSNGREIFFSHDQWKELSRMISDFNSTGAREMLNYTSLPTRTPLHANTPVLPRKTAVKPTLDDLA